MKMYQKLLLGVLIKLNREEQNDGKQDMARGNVLAARTTIV